MNRSGLAPASHSKAFIIYLFLTALLCGALIMVIEVLGSRVVGPFFGVSLFVWTSLITVTLLALAIGYWLGGVYADRHGSANVLYGIILVSGLVVLLIPMLKVPVIKLAQPLGLRGGAFVSTLILFGPALLLLGCVSPFLIKIAARELHNIGRTVGGFYAISTLGSVVGTVLTGFFLIAYLGVDQIFYIVGFLLILLAAAYFAWSRGNYLLLLLCLLPLIMPQTERFQRQIMADGTRVEQVFSTENFYGAIKVVDYSLAQTHVRELMINGQIQGGIDMHNRGSIFRYSYFLQFIPRAMHPLGERCLVIGLGAGMVPMWYEQQGVITDVVDIDPEIVKVAQDYFGFNIAGDILIEDARYFISRTQRHYDYIILDVFTGDLTPGHVISREAFAAISSRLTGSGLLVINLIGSLGEHAEGTASVVKTLQEVFDTVRIFPTFDPGERSEGNIMVLAHNGQPKVLPEFDLDLYVMHPLVRDGLRRGFGREVSLPASASGIVLTDNYNPIDVYDAWLREQARRDILDTINQDLLLSTGPTTSHMLLTAGLSGAIDN